MREYASEAIVLSREPVGELDARFAVFTERFGRLAAKAKSVRKPTSKLASHLEAGNLISVRIVEKNGLQVVDALKKRKLKASVSDLAVLAALLAESEPEPEIWNELVFSGETGRLNWEAVLRALGWDPAEACCSICDNRSLSAFRPETQDFLCENCASRLHGDGLIYI